MTREELAVLTAARPDVRLRVLPQPDAPDHLWIVTHPCPFYMEGRGCDVHPIRPYNCRRWMCGRNDPRREPFEEAAVQTVVLRSRALRRLYARTQREAQRWARAHGWHESAE